MAGDYLHGIEIKNIVDGPPAVQRVSTAIIGLCGFGLNPAYDGKLELITSREDALAKFGVKTDKDGNAVKKDDEKTSAIISLVGNGNDIGKALEAIYMQASPLILVSQAIPVPLPELAAPTNPPTPPTSDELAAIKKAQEAQEKNIGEAIDRLITAQNIVGYLPKIIVAPVFSSSQTVRTKMLAAAVTLRAIAVVDATDIYTKQEDLYKDLTPPSSRLYVVHGKLVMATIGETTASACAAGVIARVDAVRGFFESPSNTIINGVLKIVNPLSWSISNATSETNLYNEKGGTTVIRNNQGFYLWGTRTTGGASTDVIEIANQFVNVRRTTDVIDESIQRGVIWAIDKGITKNFIQEVLEAINNFMRELKFIGAIIDGNAWVDKVKNTPDRIKNGRLEFSWDYTPVYPMEQMKGNSIITDHYLKGLFT